MPNAGTLRTLRLSATSGTRTIGSMIASVDGGAGSPRRIYKFLKGVNNLNALTPNDYFFNYLGGNKINIPKFNAFYQMYSPYN
jgi:hypothetical protein